LKRGVRFGRPARLSAEQVLLARRLLEEGMSAKEVAKTFGVNRSTIYRNCTVVTKGTDMSADDCRESTATIA